MVEIGIFSEELFNFYLINNKKQHEIGAYMWVKLANNKEVVFEDGVTEIGYLEVMLRNRPVQLTILREWCKDFKPLAEL